MNIEEYITESNAIEGEYGDREVKTSIQAWHWLNEQEVLNEKKLLKLHMVIMLELRPDIAGKWRKVEVWVGNRKCPEPEEAKETALILLNADWVKTPLNALNWHVMFEHAHPFEDGNGRTGRMIYWYHCMKLGKTPILFTKKDVKGYYDLF